VKPGAHRIASSGGPVALQSVAFANPDGSLVTVVLNETDRRPASRFPPTVSRSRAAFLPTPSRAICVPPDETIAHFLACLLFVVATGLVPVVRADAPVPPAGWKLVWSDEFDRPAGLIRPGGATTWAAKGGQPRTAVLYGCAAGKCPRGEWPPCHRGPARAVAGSAYTSARLVTKNKGDWSAGRFEIRAKLPLGRGTWPAIWMLPTVWNLGDGGWPDNGEIDIMEHVGYDPGVVHASTHSQKNQWRNHNQRTAVTQVPDAGAAFHTYAMEWDAEESASMWTTGTISPRAGKAGTGLRGRSCGIFTSC